MKHITENEYSHISARSTGIKKDFEILDEKLSKKYSKIYPPKLRFILKLLFLIHPAFHHPKKYHLNLPASLLKG